MPCHHKFLEYLQLDKIDFEPEKLIVGSFSPQWPAGNTAEWFYGRTVTNYFWDILPRLYGEASLLHAGPEAWKQFCRDKKIALTDLISTIDDADEENSAHHKILGGFSDKAIMHNFDDFEFTDVVKLLREHPTIKHVYLTRGITEAFWRHLWNPVAYYCNHNQLHEHILLSPTDDAMYHHGAYNDQHPDKVIHRLEDYLLMRWREEWRS